MRRGARKASEVRFAEARLSIRGVRDCEMSGTPRERYPIRSCATRCDRLSIFVIRQTRYSIMAPFQAVLCACSPNSSQAHTVANEQGSVRGELVDSTNRTGDSIANDPLLSVGG